ncbi:hypothetical protein DRE_02611 [Drechslerella stenobrocha 248]|uniref:Uncharacterized protein n=1 Tax=Drechslerella stenobrocha 248 TaxID=1043628 RepID=W7I7F1_9PEZI|nr:hypothetical protein DRE_02611 [Drechslerella stenobrocha 248]
MGLFRKRSTSSTVSTKLKRPPRSGTISQPPEVPVIPPPPIHLIDAGAIPKPPFSGPTAHLHRVEQQQQQRNNQSYADPKLHAASSITGTVIAVNHSNNNHNAGFGSQPAAPATAAMSAAQDGFSTPVSQMSGLTHPSEAAAARSTAPSSVDAMSAISSFKRAGPPPTMSPQVQLNGRRISASAGGSVDDGFYLVSNQPRRPSLVSAIGSEFDSQPSSMTVTTISGPPPPLPSSAGGGPQEPGQGLGLNMGSGNRKPPPPPLRENPSTSTLPQEWTERDPSINTRFTHSPTPSESASMQSSVVYPQQPQREMRPSYGGLPPHPPNNNPNKKFRPPPHPHHSPPHLQNPHAPPPRFRPGGPHPPPPISPHHHRPRPHPHHRQPPDLPGPPHSYHPAGTSQRPPHQRFPQLPPGTPRGGSYRPQQNMLPSLPENRRAKSVPLPKLSPQHSPPQQYQEKQRPNMPATPGPKHIAMVFTPNHIECTTRHQNLLPMKNYHHPVPCLTCRRLSPEGMQVCSFCSLRICKECAVRLKKDWDGDITKGWGTVTPATEEFNRFVGRYAKMVVGWGDRTPPIPARNAANQLVWPAKSNTDRVCALLGLPFRPKTAPANPDTFRVLEAEAPDLIDQSQFNFDTNVELESGASTISPPSPVTPPAFAVSGSDPRLPLSLADDHRLPMALTTGKHNFESSGGYGYPRHSPEIVSDSNPELVQPQPHYPVGPASLLNPGSRPSHTYSFVDTNAALYRTNTQLSATTVGKGPTRPVTGATAKSSIFDSVKSTSDKKKSKGLKSLFSKK